MTAMSDRSKGAFASLVRASIPQIDYLAFYRAQVLVQDGTNTVGVKPDDQRLPLMAQIPLRHGMPGLVVSVAPGAHVLIGWDGGDPSKPYAQLWEGGETFAAAMQIIGNPNDVVTSVDSLVKGTTYRAAEDALFKAIQIALNNAAIDPVFTALCPNAALSIQAASTALIAWATTAPTKNSYLTNYVKVQ